MKTIIVGSWDATKNSVASNGLVRINPNKPEYGSIMLVDKAIALNNGFVNAKNKVGFITGKLEELDSLIKTYGFEANKACPLDVKIVHLEYTTQELGTKALANPETGESITSNGKQIYWKTSVVDANSPQQDIRLERDKVVVNTATSEYATAAHRK